jgi:hypothetical protein
MTTYEISTLLGTSSFGHYEGRTPADALAAMHVDAGYRVTAEDGELIWHDDADEVICGGLDRWHVRPLRLLEVLRLADLPNYLRSRAQIDAAIAAAMPHIGITDPCWWAFPRTAMLLADWAADVSRAAEIHAEVSA